MEHWYVIFPKTVDEAVDKLLPILTRKEQTRIVNMSQRDLFQLNTTLGIFIRTEFRLWGNDLLIKACHKYAAENNLDLDDPVMIIIRALHRRLRRTENLLRVVK